MKGNWAPNQYVYLHSECHPTAPTWVVMDGKQLTVICSICSKGIAGFDFVRGPYTAEAAKEATSTFPRGTGEPSDDAPQGITAA